MKYVSILRRFTACLFDYGVLLIITFSYVIFFGTEMPDGSHTVSGIKVFPLIIIWFILTCLTEYLFGATIGNGMLQLRPVDANTLSKPSFIQTVKRHLADPIDMFLFGLVAVIIIRNSPKRQRLGDQWAGTVVIKE